MSFVSATENLLSHYPEDAPERILLTYLLNNAVGRENAKPWRIIEGVLAQNGHDWRVQKFQQGLLKKSREGQAYIASNDHGEFRGYFIIDERADAELMADWYRERIATEQQRLDHLEGLILDEWG